MPNIKSVIKDVKRSRLLHERNIATKSKIKTTVKKARNVIDSGDMNAAVPFIRSAESVIDKAAEKGIIHRNAAARRKSRLMRDANKAKASS